MTDASNRVFTTEYLAQAAAMPRSYRRWWLAVALALASVLLLGWWLLARWTKTENFETLAVQALSDKTEVIALGSSHVYMMTNPELFDRELMNLSCDACNYVSMDAILRGNIDRVPNLRAVLIELDIVPLVYDTIRVYKGDNSRLLDLQPSLAELNEERPRKARLYWQRFFEYSPLTGPLVSRNKFAPWTVIDKLRHGRHNANQQFIAGYRMSDEIMSAASDGDDRILVHETEGDLAQVDASIVALCRLLEFARSRGLHVVLLRYPHHHTYWEQQPQSWDEALDRATSAVEKRFKSSEVEVWDFGKTDGFADDDFLDGDHLNARGTKKLCEMLNVKLNALLAQLSR